jgi:hypothetical protein
VDDHGVSCPVSGSIEAMSLPLNLLQTAQHREILHNRLTAMLDCDRVISRVFL